MAVKVRVDNPTDVTLHIAEAQISLRVDGSVHSIPTPIVVDVQPHRSTTLEWDFTHHALCESDRRFAIVWHQALVLGDRPVTIADLAIRP